MDPGPLLACMAAFFTADTHFGDACILRRRGCAASVNEHDETLIASWNETIGPADEVCRGNHDTNLVLNLPWAKMPVESARIRVQDSSGAEVGLYLAHDAHRSWPGLWRDVPPPVRPHAR